MKSRFQLQIYASALALILIPLAGSLYAIQGLSDTASSFSLNPSIVLELKRSGENLRYLGKLDPKHENQYHADFDQVEDMRRNYESLIESGPLLSKSYLQVFLLIFAITLIAALLIAAWLNRRVIRTHEAAVGELKREQDRNIYLENRESWRLVAQKFAHEVKNPLTPMKSLVGRLGKQYSVTHSDPHPAFAEALKETQEVVDEEIEKITRWIDSFSRFAQVPDAVVKGFDLHYLIRQFVERHRDQWDAFNLHYDVVQTVCNVRGDEGLLKQVLFNLAKNSAEAGAKNLSIEISYSRAESYRSVFLSDDGPGIPPQLSATLFAPYHTTKGSYRGMGLGLAISKRAMLDQGGDLKWIKTSVGCQFKLELSAGDDHGK